MFPRRLNNITNCGGYVRPTTLHQKVWQIKTQAEHAPYIRKVEFLRCIVCQPKRSRPGGWFRVVLQIVFGFLEMVSPNPRSRWLQLHLEPAGIMASLTAHCHTDPYLAGAVGEIPAQGARNR